MIPLLASTDASAKGHTIAQTDGVDVPDDGEDVATFGTILSQTADAIVPASKVFLSDSDGVTLPNDVVVETNDGPAVDAPDFVATEMPNNKRVSTEGEPSAPATLNAKRSEILPQTGQQPVAAPQSDGPDKKLPERTRASVAQSMVEGQLPQLKPDLISLRGRAPATPLVAATNDAVRQDSGVSQKTGQALAATVMTPPQQKDGASPKTEKVPPLEVKAQTQTPTATTQLVKPAIVTLAQAVPMLRVEEVEKTTATADPELGLTTAPNDRFTHVSGSLAKVAAAGSETARHVVTQMAIAVTNADGRTTEIALNPEELGRVRLSMTVSDGAITLNIVAERPETNDLLRRHIDALAQEFRDLGYDTMSFSFDGDGQTASADDFDDGEGIASPSDHDKEDVATLASPTFTTAGLDLRL